MCRCLQSIWEDFYWNCIEERFCFDESIANFNPDDEVNKDRNITSKSGSFGGDADGSRKDLDIIVNQPRALDRFNSSFCPKAHEDEYHREIQTAVPILAPEVLAAFAQSQIFNESQKQKKVAVATTPKVVPATGPGAMDAAAEKLLSRLEGETDRSSSDVSTAEKSMYKSNTFVPIAEEDETDDRLESSRHVSLSSQNLPLHRKPHLLAWKQVQSVPQLYQPPPPLSSSQSTQRPPGGEGTGEIFTIFKNLQTPEIPSISLKRLPRNYLETPAASERYTAASSLTSIQLENKKRGDDMFNFQMPRYYGQSELYLPTPAISQDEINASSSNSTISSSINRGKQMLSGGSFTKTNSMGNLHVSATEPFVLTKKTASVATVHSSGSEDGNKRLKALRGHLSPLRI